MSGIIRGGGIIRTESGGGAITGTAPYTPLWMLDATVDFPTATNGDAVSQWTGTGITSSTQGTSGARPTFSGKAVTFDGGDFLSFPMWTAGIGASWTLAALIKFDTGLANYQTFWGASTRALETYWFKDGLSVVTAAGTEAALIGDGGSLTTPNSNWRAIVITCTGGNVTCRIDGISQTHATAMGIVAGLTGSWRLGKGYDAATPAKFTIRWMAFYSAVLSANQITLLRWYLRAKKRSENPTTIVQIGGGQSNHQYSSGTTTVMRSAVLSNSSFAIDGGTGGTPLYYWWRFKNNDALQGQELCPVFDVSAAPNGTVAKEATGKFRGQATLDSWDACLEGIADNPRTSVFFFWIEGETATGDSRYTWLPNNTGAWTSAPTDPYWNADNYGTLATGWNAFLRDRYASTAYFIYHFISFPAALNPGAIQEEGIVRRNWNVRQAMASDTRWLANDITDFPREADNIHLSNPATAPGSVPNTGSECLGRAQIRLANKAAKLATLAWSPRMLAMRTLDVGFELSDGQIDACTTFAASTGFSDIYSLTIPVLTATSAFDQARARRCNLMVHTKDRYNSKFATSAPANTIVRCNSGANTSAISTAVTALLTAWGLSNTVTVTADTPPFSMATYSPILSVDASIAASKLDASDATAADGAAIKTWVDQSGNSRNLTQSTSGARPVNRATDGTLRFDGVDDFLSATFPNMGNQFAVVFVGTKLSGTAYSEVLAFDTNMLCGWYGGSSFTLLNNTYQEFAIATPGTKKVHIARFDPSVGGLWINTTRHFTGGTGSVTRTTPTGQMGRRTDGLFANMDLNEFYVINRALSDAEVAEIYTGLMAKHGL